MQRRKFIAGIGSLAAAGAAGIGTGAVSQITADRDANLQISYDENAYLGLEPGSGAGEYVNQGSDGTLSIDFTSTSGGGAGLNNRADTVLEDAFEIKNQSDRDLHIWTGFAAPNNGTAIPPTSGAARSVELVADGTDITYPGDGNKDDEPATSRVIGHTDETGAISIEAGNSASVDINLLVYGSNDPRESDFLTVFRADEDDPDGTTASDHQFSVNV